MKSNTLFRFSCFAYAMGAVCFVAAIVFQFAAIHGASSLALNSLSWFAMGFLAGCLAQSVRQWNQRLDQIEAQLK